MDLQSFEFFLDRIASLIVMLCGFFALLMIGEALFLSLRWLYRRLSGHHRTSNGITYVLGQNGLRDDLRK